MEKSNYNVFEYRLDYYWKSLSLYAIVLSIFILIKESISNTKIIETIYQPIIFLLIFITIITTIALLYQIYQKKKIIIEDTKLMLKNRWFSKIINFEDIKKIVIRSSKYRKLDNYRLIFLEVKGRHRAIRINPAYYDKENILIEEFARIKKELNL